MILMLLGTEPLERREMGRRFGYSTLTRQDRALFYLQQAGLVIFRGDRFEITEAGRARLNKPHKSRQWVEAEKRIKGIPQVTIVI